MNIRRIFNIVLVALAVAASFSCKKKEEETSKKFLKGGLSFDVDAYMQPGTAVKLTASGVTHPEDKPLGYYWTVSDIVKADTTKFDSADDKRDGSFTLCFPDTLGTFTVTGAAYAADYYSSTASAVVTVVKPGMGEGATIDNVEQNDDEQILDDNRKSQPKAVRYMTCSIGGTMWMKQNLAYTEKDNPKGIAYQDAEAISEVLGRYYSWEEAQTVCPEGYHLPSESELMAVVQTSSKEPLKVADTWKNCAGSIMTKASFNGERMWEFWPDVNITNIYGLTILPTGYCNLIDKTFTGILEVAAIWTRDEFDSEKGVYRYIVADQPHIYRGAGNKKSFGASVRCVED